MVPINYWAVLVAAIAQIALGWLWYGPLFGKPWMAMMGMTPEKMNEARAKGAGKSLAITVIGSLIMAWVLAHAIIFGNAYLMMSGAFAGVMGAFFIWLGFVAPITMGSALWEGKPWKLWILNAGYYLVGFSIMGAILSSWT